MSNLAGIAADGNLPVGGPLRTGLGGVNDDSADAAYDLARMLSAVRELPGVGGLRPTAERYLGPTAEPIEIVLELELDAAAPHVDLARQLAQRIERIVARRGVDVGRTVLELLDSIAAQARRAWIARHGPAQAPRLPVDG